MAAEGSLVDSMSVSGGNKRGHYVRNLSLCIRKQVSQQEKMVTSLDPFPTQLRTSSPKPCEPRKPLPKGEAAWVWDAAQIDWQANEVELVAQGQLLRIDRLVKHTSTQTWWVLDYKSNPAPQRVAELTAQIMLYKDAVKAAYPQDKVKAAFITAQGQLIEI
jgi:ATP-dependent exoDNAse (exonuclease V) beta subunit